MAMGYHLLAKTKSLRQHVCISQNMWLRLNGSGSNQYSGIALACSVGNAHMP